MTCPTLSFSLKARVRCCSDQSKKTTAFICIRRQLGEICLIMRKMNYRKRRERSLNHDQFEANRSKKSSAARQHSFSACLATVRTGDKRLGNVGFTRLVLTFHDISIYFNQSTLTKRWFQYVNFCTMTQKALRSNDCQQH